MRVIVIGGSAALLAGAALGLGLVAPAAAQSSAFLAANLLGQDVPGGGDQKASGNFNGEVNLARNTLCYYLDMDGLGDANAVHIHQKDQAGTDAPALTLKVPASGGSETCADGDNATLSAIAKTPGDYYIDVHSAAHPEGAVRGKLTE